jgi:hypothetical protein
MPYKKMNKKTRTKSNSREVDRIDRIMQRRKSSLKHRSEEMSNNDEFFSQKKKLKTNDFY